MYSSPNCVIFLKQSGNSFRETIIATLFVNPSQAAFPTVIISTVLCCGCKNLFSSDDINECRSCERLLCPKCSCQCNPKPSPSSLLFAAKPVVEAYAYRTSGLSPTDITNFVIEDEFGGLEVVQGEVRPIIGAEPVLDKIFADQLPREAAKIYEARQLAVWEQGIVSGGMFPLLTCLVAILPLFVEGQRFTISLFLDGALNLF